MLESLKNSLDRADLAYLSDLLYTIKTSKQFAALIIPLQAKPSNKSNFYRVSYKIENLLKELSPNEQPCKITTPIKSLANSKPKANKLGLKA